MPIKDKPEKETDRARIKRAREAAQKKLGDVALKLAVRFLYEHFEKTGWEPTTTLKDGQKLGKTEAEVLETLTSIEDEYSRLRTFNQFAKENGYNLTLKSKGAKTPESIGRKINHPDKAGKPISDEVRITVVSSDIVILDRFAEQLQAALTAESQKQESQPDNLRQRTFTPAVEEWSMQGSALLNKVIKNSVDRFGAEVQFMPREQARMAARITHHFYKISRTHDDVTKSFADLPTEKDKFTEFMGNLGRQAAFDNESLKKLIDIRRKLKAKIEMMEDYNRIAAFLNKLSSHEVMGQKDRDEANDMLKNMDTSSFTLDEASEGGEQGNRGQKEYSPIFKTMKDIMSYRTYMQEKGREIGLFPLPHIDQTTSPAKVEAAMYKLRVCSQLTHACYINDAKTPVRNLWVKEARKANANLRNDPAKQIPECAIECIDHTLGDQHQPPPKRHSRDR
jgi:hypothetical protein